MKSDYLVGNTLIEMEDKNDKKEDAKILEEYYERIRKQREEGKEKKN